MAIMRDLRLRSSNKYPSLRDMRGGKCEVQFWPNMNKQKRQINDLLISPAHSWHIRIALLRPLFRYLWCLLKSARLDEYRRLHRRRVLSRIWESARIWYSTENSCFKLRWCTKQNGADWRLNLTTAWSIGVEMGNFACPWDIVAAFTALY